MIRLLDWLFLSKWPRRILLSPLALHPVFAARFLWHWRPSIYTAVPFWCVAILWLSAVALEKGDAASVVVIVGAACNAAVVLRNSGRMPVIGKPKPGMRSVWIRANRRHRWLFLADRHNWYGFSVGDAVIGLAVLIRLLTWMVA